MSPQLEIQIIAVITAVTCTLPGVFLVLRKMSMITDSISHTILLGIVLGYLLTDDLSSPLLIIGAALVGVITVWLTECISRTGLVSNDSAIGAVFPLLFSIAVILISKYTGSIHLDTDSVLLGELAFSPFHRLLLFGKDVGAKAIYTSGLLFIINSVCIVLFFKELKLTTFDPVLASVIGFSPALIHYGLMGLTSLTAVGAFETAGSVLVVAFMIGPPTAAYLLSNDLKVMILLSSIFGAVSSVIGYHIAALFDLSIAGCIAVLIGFLFLLTLIAAPKRGLLYTLTNRYRQRINLGKDALILYISRQENSISKKESIQVYFNWAQRNMKYMLKRMQKEKLIEIKDEQILLTNFGLTAANTLAAEQKNGN